MVEFGLKLSDNKVSKWADKYLNYERLKGLLKKVKAAQKALNDVSSRRSEKLKALGYTITTPATGTAMTNLAFIPPLGTPSHSSHSSLSSLHHPNSSASDQAVPPKSRSNPTSGSPWSSHFAAKRPSSPPSPGLTEASPLLRSPSPPPPPGSSSSTSLVGLAKTVAGKINPFRNNEEVKAATAAIWDSRLTKATEECEMRVIEFGACLRDECRKVEAFYCKKVEEYKVRLEILEEAVEMKVEISDEQVDVARKRHKYSIADVAKALTGKRTLDSVEDGLDKAGDDAPPLPTPNTDEDDDDDYDYDPESFSELVKSDSIKRAILDMHRNVKLLSNYSIMNYTGFVKIVKKHDKVLPEYKGAHSSLTSMTRFHDGAESTALCSRMESLYASWFCDDNLLQARAQMLPKVGDGLQMDWSMLRVGYRLGMCAVLAVWVCWDCIWQVMVSDNQSIGGTVAFPVFRASGGLLLVHWCWGLSTFVWTRFRINYIYLFEFDPRNVNSALGILTEAVDETLVYLLLMLLYYKSCVDAIPKPFPSGVYALMLVLYTVKCAVFPWRLRKNLWETVGNVVISPARPATFFGTYVADVITSLIKNLQDWAWTTCYIFQGSFLEHKKQYRHHPEEHWQNTFTYTNIVIPLICLLPIWFRLMQCLRRYHDTGRRWPNLANALKYSLSQTVTLFGTFHPLYMYNTNKEVKVGVVFGDDDETPAHRIVERPPVDLYQVFWIGLFICSSMYSFAWDVWMDWGLGRKEYNWLGPRLMFPHQTWYYAAIFADIFLRFLWVTSLVPPDSGALFAFPSYLTALVLAAEILRRTVWGFLRLEQEHRHNTEGYRRVDFVPLHFNTGHDHQYKDKGEKRGMGVLAEVFAVGVIVIAISIASIIAAQKQTIQL